MAKRRGYPDRRGMGAQSDFISQTFQPDKRYKLERSTRAQALIAAGFSPAQVAALFSISLAELAENPTSSGKS